MKVFLYKKNNIKESLKKNPIIKALDVIFSDKSKNNKESHFILKDLEVIYENCPIVGRPIEYSEFIKNGC